MNQKLIILVGLLSGLLIVVSSKYHTTFFVSEIKNPQIAVKDSVTNKIGNLDLEEYIVGVVAAEMPASFNMEALKAQAVAARTYAVYKIEHSNQEYDVVTDVSNQSYIDINKMKLKWQDDFNKYYTKVKEAVDSTKGKVLTYNGDVIIAFYFAMSNGYTEEASLVFGEDQEYLKSVPSTYDNESLKNFTVTLEMSKKEFGEKLNIDSQNIVIGHIDRSDSQRVNTIEINQKVFTGKEIRSKLGLRSTDFTMQVNNENVIITTRGYGHGVGMSQYGANGMANAGQNYEEILKYFYQNVQISSI